MTHQTYIPSARYVSDVFILLLSLTNSVSIPHFVPTVNAEFSTTNTSTHVPTTTSTTSTSPSAPNVQIPTYMTSVCPTPTTIQLLSTVYTYNPSRLYTSRINHFTLITMNIIIHSHSIHLLNHVKSKFILTLPKSLDLKTTMIVMTVLFNIPSYHQCHVNTNTAIV